MTTRPRPHPVAETIPCDVCHKEIPLSEAQRFEAQDYVAHFCGLDCYSTWQQRSETLKQQARKKQR
ncbi:MAG: DUF3330 domain-containing protein [Nitrosomonadales bacterium]|nr:DUF3330 domain-containing protein [Nitrosomonadales bacterium]